MYRNAAEYKYLMTALLYEQCTALLTTSSCRYFHKGSISKSPRMASVNIPSTSSKCGPDPSTTAPDTKIHQNLNDDSNVEQESKISKTVTGSCHCGYIKFSFTDTFSVSPTTGNIQLEATRCNCTFCQKFRTTNYTLKNGAEKFKLSASGGRGVE